MDRFRGIDWTRRSELIGVCAKWSVDRGETVDEWSARRLVAERWEQTWRRAGAWTVRLLLTRKHRVRKRPGGSRQRGE